MHICFQLIISKIVALLLAFSRRRLSKSLELLTKTNKLIWYVFLSAFLLVMAANITTLTVFIVSVGVNQKILVGKHIVRYSLVSLITSGVFQFILLAGLWPLACLFNKAIKMQKLQRYFKEKKTWTIRIFVFAYIARSIVIIVHGLWAITQLIELNDGYITYDQVIQSFQENELFLLADECVNLFTELMVSVFFLMLARNMQRVKTKIDVIEKKVIKKRGRSNSEITVSTLR